MFILGLFANNYGKLLFIYIKSKINFLILTQYNSKIKNKNRNNLNYESKSEHLNLITIELRIILLDKL